jgi:hypothetical protein
MSVVIVVPAFNEAATIAGVVAGARAHAPVLVVDDGSTDATAAQAEAAGAEVIRHSRRRGKGAALATGFAAARERHAAAVVTLDADGQHDACDLPALLAAAREAPRAIVIGSRRADLLPHDRSLAIQLAGFWVNWITGTPVADTQSGFRVYPLALLDDVALRGDRFVLETEVVIAALCRGWEIREVPIRVVPYAARRSRFHPVGDGVAITAHLVAGALGRWKTELGAGVRECFVIFSRERRQARHARMLAKASVHAGTPTWGPAIGVAAMDEVQGRLSGWWQHPRARRAARVALATASTPAFLLVFALTAAVRGALPGWIDRTARRIFDQRALPAITPSVPDARAEDTSTWATVPR